MTTEQFTVLSAVAIFMLSAAAFGIVAGRLKSRNLVDENGIKYSAPYS